MSSSEDKKDIRDRIKRRRAELQPNKRAMDSLQIAMKALAIPMVSRATGALSYGATPDEVDAGPLLAFLRARGARGALPRVEGSELTLHWAEGNFQLERGAFGLTQPTADTPLAADEAIDLIIVPGVAFDAEGNRLGYGAGYYDRLLARFPGVPTVGLAYDEQIVDGIPVEEHDVPIDFVVTPTRILGAAVLGA